MAGAEQLVRVKAASARASVEADKEVARKGMANSRVERRVTGSLEDRFGRSCRAGGYTGPGSGARDDEAILFEAPVRLRGRRLRDAEVASGLPDRGQALAVAEPARSDRTSEEGLDVVGAGALGGHEAAVVLLDEYKG